MALFQFSILQAVAGIVLTLLTYQIVVGIYRVTLHPLAKYPGPFLYQISQWPEAINAYLLRRHLDLDELHEKYGDIVRFSPNKLSFRSPKAWEDIYTDRHANLIKDGFTAAGLKMNNTYHTHNLSDRKLHHARRKLLNHAFSESAMKDFEPHIVEKINFWCAQLARQDSNDLTEKPTSKSGGWSQKRNMGSWSGYLTVDILGQLCFNQDWESCKNEGSVWDEVIVKVMAMTTSLCQLPIRELFYPIIKSDRIMSWLPMTGPSAHLRFKQTAGACVTQRFALQEAEKDKSKAEQSKDFFYHLMQAKNPETGETFLPMDLVGEALLLVVAGSDTSSTALAASFFYLLNNPRVLTKLTKEIRGAFTDVEEIRPSASKIKELVYLRACIDESMRMSPPVPTLLDRLVLPGGADIDGTHVPGGISVGVPIYTLHHNEKYHEHAHQYIPERWIEGSLPAETGFKSVVTEAKIKDGRSAFVPFSTGTRGCVGKNLAYMELLTALSRAVYLFDLKDAELPATKDKGGAKMDSLNGVRRMNKNEYQLQDVFVAKRDGPMVQFKQAQMA